MEQELGHCYADRIEVDVEPLSDLWAFDTPTAGTQISSMINSFGHRRSLSVPPSAWFSSSTEHDKANAAPTRPLFDSPLVFHRDGRLVGKQDTRLACGSIAKRSSEFTYDDHEIISKKRRIGRPSSVAKASTMVLQSSAPQCDCATSHAMLESTGVGHTELDAIARCQDSSSSHHRTQDDHSQLYATTTQQDGACAPQSMIVSADALMTMIRQAVQDAFVDHALSQPWPMQPEHYE